MKSNKIFLFNDLNHKGSPETTREINNNNLYFKNLNDKFKFWFVGFTEGDGSFSIYKDKYL